MKRRRVALLTSICLLLALLSGCAQKPAQPANAGTISEDTTFSQDTTLEDGAILEELATLTVNVGAKLIIPGTFHVKGTLKLTGVTWETLLGNNQGSISFYPGSRLYIDDKLVVGEVGNYDADIMVGTANMRAVKGGSGTMTCSADIVTISGKVFLNTTLEDARFWDLGADSRVILYADQSLDFQTFVEDGEISVAVVDTYGGTNDYPTSQMTKENVSYYYTGSNWKYFDLNLDLTNPDVLGALLGYVEYATIADNRWQSINGVQTWNGAEAETVMLGADEVVMFTVNEGTDGTVIRDIKYADREGTRNGYDLWLPKYIADGQQQGRDVPVILFIHGGSWSSGHKEGMDALCAQYTKLGYVTASIDYRLTNEALAAIDNGDFFDMMQDIEDTVTNILMQLENRGYTATTMAVSGQSSGGHLAMLYAATYGEESPIPVKLVLDEYGPADFTVEAWADTAMLWSTDKTVEWRKEYKTLDDDPYKWEKLYSAGGTALGILNMHGVELEEITEENKKAIYTQIMADEKNPESQVYQVLQKISPTHAWEKYKIPLVGIHGETDSIVAVEQAYNLKAELERLGVDHCFIITAVDGHGMGKDAEAYQEYYAKSLEYLERYLKPAQ